MSRMFFVNPPVVDLPAAQRCYEAVDPVSEGASPDPADAIPGFCLDDRRGLRLADSAQRGAGQK